MAAIAMHRVSQYSLVGGIAAGEILLYCSLWYSLMAAIWWLLPVLRAKLPGWQLYQCNFPVGCFMRIRSWVVHVHLRFICTHTQTCLHIISDLVLLSVSSLLL